MNGLCNVWLCVCIYFLMSGCVYVWFCNVGVCVCMDFVMSGCVYVLVL